MLESLITTLDKFTPEILVILSGLLVITTTLFLWLWFANRRTYNMLKHQLPASVVKSYLDTVISNSNNLKTALFRGGGQEVDPAALNVPNLFPVMPTISGEGGDAALREQLQQKLAELAAIQSQLASANGVKKDLESNLTGANARIKELEAMLAKAGENKGAAAPAAAGGGADPAELKKVTKERDELREKLKEYEIIEDDLANLKRLQQENAQLKKALGDGSPSAASAISGGSEPAPAAAAKMSGQDPLAGAHDLFDDVPSSNNEQETTAELEQFLSTGSEGDAPAPEEAAAAAPEEEAPKAEASNEKTPEDLLSEFEKMLG